jgi:valyl-tRNA synthetase
MKQLPQGQYNFKETEQKILDFWLSKPFYKPEYNPKTGEVESLEEYKNSNDPKWTLVCPPPNAYDRPHMGNLSGYPYMDALARYHRLDGKRVLVMPGKDHAGIEGEISYIKYVLEPQGKGKFDFDRDEFYKNVWEMQQGFRASIQQDEKNIGLSADFDRDLYTLDPKVVNEVLGTFIQMYQDGLIYKGVRIVNWDPKSQSSISDSQCERKEQMGKLYYIKYKLVDEDGYLMVATTRPETMLGDTALVVNPTDERYKHLVGKKVIVPLANREIPIITSGRIEKDFGTGVLKLTPAHAPDDYEIMIEWNTMVEKLERDNPTVFDSAIHQKVDYLNIIDRYTKLCGPIPEKYKGLKVNPAREAVVADLKEAGMIEKEEDLMQNLLISERTGAVIEPIMSSQWYIDVSGLKQKLIDIVANGEVRIYPKTAEKRYFAWVNNLRDWAISRNLWWGYRLPVWYNGKMEERINAEGKIRNFLVKDGQEIEFDPRNPDHMKVQQENPGEGWVQDDEILDTWFSSGQWPYLCLQTAGLLDTNYPTDALVSGYDLLIKWDLTMMLFSLYKTGTVPFKNLYLTGLVKGTDGQKMSKSKRNFVPIDDVKEQYGIDSFRMNCFYQNKAGRAYAITPDTLKAFRNFNNKIWNASKFVMMNLEGLDQEPWFEELRIISTAVDYKMFVEKHPELKLEEEDSLMISKLEMIEAEFKSQFEKYRFGMLSEELYNEFWHSFCDLYIEQTKSRVWKDRETGEYKSTPESRKAAQATLFYTLKTFLKMLHPFIPFITEEIWQHLVEDGTFDVAMMYRK